MQKGLTMVIGPPGTGKVIHVHDVHDHDRDHVVQTDVAVQIIVNLFHQYPKERVLLVTHSNHA